MGSNGMSPLGPGPQAGPKAGASLIDYDPTIFIRGDMTTSAFVDASSDNSTLADHLGFLRAILVHQEEHLTSGWPHNYPITINNLLSAIGKGLQEDRFGITEQVLANSVRAAIRTQDLGELVRIINEQGAVGGFEEFTGGAITTNPELWKSFIKPQQPLQIP